MTSFNRLSLLIVLILVAALTGCPSSNGPSGGVIPLDDTVPGDAGEADGGGPFLCQSDADCPDGYCDPFSGICVDCVMDEHCGDGMICDKWSCVPAQECEEDSDCDADQVCDPDKGICVDCLSSVDCPEGQVCVDQACLISCLDGSPCPDDSVCDPETNACVECLSDVDCAEPQWCHLGEKLCFPDVCDPGDFACDGNAVVQCLDNGSGWSDPMPCPNGTACIDGVCEEGKICVPDLITCKDETTIEECNEDGTIITEIPCPNGTTCVNGDCTEECVPDCVGKECGTSGCPGYSCGSCPDGQHCGEFECVAGECDPGDTTCQWDLLVECAPDPEGLGYWMDPVPCPPGEACEDGECFPMDDCGDISWLGCCQDNTLMYCENGQLVIEECSDDGPCGWSPNAEFYDCGTNGNPEPSGTYPMDCVPCIPECAGKECGSDGCGGNCGSCPGNSTCDQTTGQCIPCQPDCQGKDCGGDGCGGSCGQCGPNEECTPGGICLGPGCMPGESLCDGDLLLICGPDGEWYQEPCPPGFTCEDGQCMPPCSANCINKDCGPDGCGGNCGVCPAGASCDPGGICVNACQPECPDWVECGSDGCGSLCGLCDNDEACVDGECKTSLTCVEMQQCNWQCGWDEECGQECWQDASVDAQLQWMEVMQCIMAACGQPPSEGCWQSAIGNGGACQDEYNACQDCTPECEGLQCGADGCGGTCGSCPPGYVCDDYGYCLCSPDCDDKECGPDGCGGQCGFCPGNDVCNYLGACVCSPDCLGKECGADGCGGSCGYCAPGDICSNDGMCEQVQCPQGQVPDCNDNCAPYDWVGDGYCDEEESQFGADFNCEEFDWDAGDCEEDNCGNQYCQEYMGEDCESCPEDCGPCGGGCDQPGFIEDCNKDCRPEWLLGNGVCNQGQGGGPNGGADFNCEYYDWDEGDCAPEPFECGDGWCDWEMGEDCETCPWDCGFCGEGECCEAHDSPGCEDPEIMDCVCSFDQFCCQNYWDDICVNEAIEQCGLWCEQDWCDELCQEFECGEWEDCWCGDCPNGQECIDGQCEGQDPLCDLLCQFTECGDIAQCDCGGCPWGEECIQNQCVGGPDCDELCWNMECGEIEGCWCGECPPGAICTADGQCEDVGDGMSCQELVECAFDCGFGATCIFDCYSEGSEIGQAQFQELSLCVLQICGSPDPSCFQEAVAGPCGDAFQQCY